MPIKFLVLLLGIVAGTANADSFIARPSLSANIAWQFGGSELVAPSLGLQARYGSAYGPTMQLADIQWRATQPQQMGFHASLMGVPLVVDSVRADATAGGVAKGIGLATLGVVVVGAAVVSNFIDKHADDIVRCAASENCGEEDGGEASDNREEEEPSGDNQFPSVP